MNDRKDRTPVIEVRNLSHTYTKGESGTKALGGVNFKVNKGDFIALLGPSGCGKTTCLNIMAGFIKPTRGKVLAYGKEVKGPSPDKGVIFQEPTLFPWLSVWDNVMWGPNLKKKVPEEAIERAKYLIKRVGLEEFTDAKPYELSGGMQHRIGVLRTLVNDPDAVLADEPYAALDAHTRRDLQKEFEGIWEEKKKAVVWVTHQIEEAVYMAEEVIVLTKRPGKIKERVKIDIERPRDRLSEEFVKYEQQIRDLLTPEL